MAVRHLVRGSGTRGLAVRGLVLLLVLALAVTVYAAWPRGSAYERATRLLPAGTERVLWTDWTGVREELDCRVWVTCEQQLGDSDLGAASALTGAATALEGAFGWGPRTIGWELLGQGTDGQVLVVGGLDAEELESVATSYQARGFTEPERDPMDGGVWQGSADELAGLGLTDALFANVAFLADEGVLLSSDDPGWLETAVEAARAGDGDFALAGRAGQPIAAVGLAGDRACSELSFADADPGARAEAERIVDEAGGVTPLDGYLVALGADRAWTAVLGHESDEQAERDLAPRQRLAVAEDPGQMESYPDLFTVDSAEVDGSAVVLRGRAGDATYALTQVTQGPVLLASC